MLSDRTRKESPNVMKDMWEHWLVQHPDFTLSGGDDDGEDLDIDQDDDYEDDDYEDDAEARDSDSEDDDDDADDSSDDTARRLRNLEKDNRRLSRELEAATELLNKAAESEGSDGEPPEGFVAQEDYEALIDLLRTDYVQNAISGFTKKDGTPKWDWEDPSAVYKFLDVDELEIDVKSKTIDGLEDQLADIAERYPFMLKGNGVSKSRGSTGKPPRKPGSRESHKDPSLEALAAEFPALID